MMNNSLSLLKLHFIVCIHQMWYTLKNIKVTSKRMVTILKCYLPSLVVYTEILLSLIFFLIKMKQLLTLLFKLHFIVCIHEVGNNLKVPKFFFSLQKDIHNFKILSNVTGGINTNSE